MGEILERFASLKLSLIFVAILLANVLGMVAWSFVLTKPGTFRLAGPHRIAVLGAHLDDGVIEAGGLVIENSELGGRTTVVTLTVPADTTKARIRTANSERAWGLVGASVNLIRLGFPSKGRTRQWTPRSRAHALDSLRDVLRRINPDIVVIPLREGGHPEHDLLNRLGRTAFESVVPHATLLQAAEYNPYLQASKTPLKVLRFFIRLAPYVPYRDPSTGLDPARQERLEMSPQTLELKDRMLLAFTSQAEVIPLSQFGYPDLFDATQKLPSGMVTLAGKHMSAWTLLLLLSIVAFLGQLGFAVGWRARAIVQVVLVVGGMVVVGIILKSPRSFIEDFTYVAVFETGAAAALVLRLARLTWKKATSR